jgi:hypothetical protein
MAYRIILRRDSSQNWEQSNPVLLSGEPGYETDTGKLKIGNGVSTWDVLDYYYGLTGPQGATGAQGATGDAGTGPNNFYGNQTIAGPTGTIVMLGYSTINFTDDTEAASGGIPLGGIYHNNGLVRIRLV